MGNPFAKNRKRAFLEFRTRTYNNQKNLFLEIVKPLFCDKITVQKIINLTEDGKILSSDTGIANTFNDYFSNVVQNINILRENSMSNTDLA